MERSGEPRPSTRAGPGNPLRRLLSVAAILALVAISLGASTPGSGPLSPEDVEAWREDLQVLTKELRRRHANLFHSVSPAELDAAVEELHDRIPNLRRHEILVGMARVAAMVGDGHTAVPLLFDPEAGLHAVPMRLGWYRDGLWVEAADAALEPVLGARVTAVGGVPVDEAVRRLEPLISRDNDVWMRVMAPLLLTRTEILHAVGLGEDPLSAVFTVAREASTRSIRLEALPSPTPLDHDSGSWRAELTEDWHDALAVAEAPLHLRHAERAYWWTHLPESGLLYFQFNRTQNAPHGPPVAELFDEMLRFGEERGVERLVLDVRYNTGGEGFLNRPLVRELIRWTGRHPRSLFVIIGPHTFSAAQMLVHELEWWTDARFVGAPTGSSPRFYGDHSFFRLPNHGVLASAAPTWWQPGGPYDRRSYLAPQTAAEPVFADYVAGRDPALEAILGWEDLPRIETAVEPARRGDLEAAEEGLRRWAAEPENRYVRPHAELNHLAYRVARDDGWKEALPLFRLNVRVHPEEANPWDSLGEALLVLGRTDEALDAYREAFRIDPDVGRAGAVLSQHGALPDAPARSPGVSH